MVKGTQLNGAWRRTKLPEVSKAVKTLKKSPYLRHCGECCFARAVCSLPTFRENGIFQGPGFLSSGAASPTVNWEESP